MNAQPGEDMQLETWESEGGATPMNTEASRVALPADLTPPGLITGIVTDMRPDQGIGFIASATYRRPWRLRFRRAGLRFNNFDDLTVGD